MTPRPHLPDDEPLPPIQAAQIVLHRVFPGNRSGVRGFFEQPRPSGESVPVRGAVSRRSREPPLEEPAAVPGASQPQVGCVVTFDAVQYHGTWRQLPTPCCTALYGVSVRIAAQ